MLEVFRNLLGSFTPASPSPTYTRVELLGAVLGSGSVGALPQLITFDNAVVVSPITPTLAGGLWVRLTLTSNAAYTLNIPSGTPAAGQTLLLTVRNTIGGAAGVQTFGAGFRATAWVQPATGNSRSASYVFDGSVWVETSRSAADVPN